MGGGVGCVGEKRDVVARQGGNHSWVCQDTRDVRLATESGARPLYESGVDNVNCVMNIIMLS